MTATTVEGANRDFVDPTAPGYLEDPYPFLARVRDVAPIHRHPTAETWNFLRYDDVELVLREPALSHMHKYAPATPRARMISAAVGGETYLRTPGFAGLDRPEHDAPRAMLSPPFGRRSVEALRTRAEEIVDGVLAGKRDGATLNLVAEIGYPLPYRLTCDVLGIPPLDDVSELRDWTWKGLQLAGAFLSAEEYLTYAEGSRRLNAHLREVIAWKREHLGDDVASLIIGAYDRGELFGSADEAVRSLQTLYHAGMDTTVNQTALSVLALMRNRSQWELLARRPELLDNAVEELLRYDPTAQFMTRTVPSDYEISGAVVPAGSQVIAFIASANRDAARFGPTADDLDITREDARYHIAFGKGIHTCLGSWLARLELRVVLGALVTRFPRTELAGGDLEWSSTPFIRGLAELPLTLGA